MLSKKNDYKYRKDAILGIVVEEHIRTMVPVSSGYIAGAYMRDLSPASIRNVLAELEREGFLTHPHTSAGRIPTQEGYRYYVDNLMKEINLLEEEKLRIKQAYWQKVQDLEDVLEKTSQMISDLTHYTSIVSIDNAGHRIYCKGIGYIVEYPDTVDLKKVQDILLALEEKERILGLINRDIERKIGIYIGHELACVDIDSCSLAVSRFVTSRGPTGRMAVLGPTRMNYSRVVSALEYVSEFLSKSF